MAERLPEQVGEWHIRRLLGQGGMALVYEAENASGERVALKWLHGASPTLVARFLQEIHFLERLSHPNVVRYRGHGCWDGRPYVLMDHVEGQDLRVYAEKLRSRPPAERHARVRAIARDLCRALGHVHAQGVIHRDVKPSNILLGADGRAVLTDFGVACAGDAPVTAVGLLVGTAAYAAPEQLGAGVVDARADQYGLGCTLYFLLTGRRPFDEETTAGLLHAHLERAPRPPSDRDPTIPPDLDGLVRRLMGKRPEERFRDMAAVEAAIGDDAAASLPLAGRQAVIDAVAVALRDVARGRGVVLRLHGARGSGRRWVEQLARDGADRRDVSFIATDDPDALASACGRVASGEALLVVTRVATPGAVEVVLPPLTVADVRRSTWSFAPKTPDLSRVAERLHRESGGNAGIFLALVQRYRDGDAVVLPTGPLDVDAAAWIDGLDLDEGAVAGALAALPGPAPLGTVERVAQVPAEVILGRLEERGVASSVGSAWVLAAECLRHVLLDAQPDRDAIEARARAEASVEARPAHDPVLARAAALRTAGQLDAAEALLRASIGRDEPDAGRLLALGGLLWNRGDARGARGVYEQALVAAGPGGTRVRACISAGACALQDGDLRAALDRLSEAVTECELEADDAHLAVALLNLSEARALHGELAESLRAARRALSIARGRRDRALECAGLRHLGQTLLDVGMAAEASRLLADASALARALDLDGERLAAQLLRARATLEERAANRTAAATALDRLLPLLAFAGPDPEGVRVLVRCVWAQAAAVLADLRMYRRALAEAEAGVADQRLAVRLRAEVILARAALTAGDVATALARAERVQADAGELRLFAWEASRVAARARNESLPGAGSLGVGLDPEEARALERRG